MKKDKRRGPPPLLGLEPRRASSKDVVVCIGILLGIAVLLIAWAVAT